MQEYAAWYNEVVVPEPHLDIEQLITFLEDSPATDYRQFADDLRDVFSLCPSESIGRCRK